jgi:3,4-dihydroxy 2-butanone 4-phosphate synthase/GTP cyclohydrolase II
MFDTLVGEEAKSTTDLSQDPIEISTTEAIIADLRAGRMVVIMDDEDRENEGDILMASQFVTPEAINFMARQGCGLICMTMTAERAERLNLPLMVQNNKTPHMTNFTVSFEGAQGVDTGISACDRATTIQAAIRPDASADDIITPGHIFGLIAKPQGVLERPGHTEAGCDFARLAGLEPSATIVEILNEDGTMARAPQLAKFVKKHGLKLGTIRDLIEYRRRHGV